MPRPRPNEPRRPRHGERDVGRSGRWWRWSLSGGLVLLIAAGEWIHSARERAAPKDVGAELENVGALKIEQVPSGRAERLGDGQALVARPALARLAKHLRSGSGDRPLLGEGVLAGEDDSGVPVMALVGLVPHSSWLLGAELDNGEIAERWRTRDTLLVTVMALLAALLYGSVLLLRMLRRHAELRCRERYLRTLLDGLPFSVWLKDESGRLLAANLEYARAARAESTAELEGRKDFDFFARDLAEKCAADDHAVMDARAPMHVEEQYTGERGEGRWKETWKAPVIIDHEVVGTVGYSRDVTERKRAEDALQHSEEKSSKVFSLSPLAKSIATMEGGVLREVNDAFLRMIGRERSDVLGRSVYDLDLWRDSEQGRRVIAELAAGREVMDRPVTMRTASGAVREVRFWATAINLAGAPHLLATMMDVTDSNRMAAELASQRAILAAGGAREVALCHDISERRRMEVQLERLVAGLRHSNADLEQFAYVASHDLKAPLRAIENLASWIEEDLAPVLTEESGRHLALMRQRVGRMERLLEDLLAYSRAGRIQAEPSPVDVAALVREVVEMVSPPPGFAVRLAESVPPFVTAVTPLRTVLLNLVSNAIKHHDRGAGVVEVGVKARDEVYEFAVADDGPGILPAFHERIWGMFQTLRPRDEVEGSGMGLAMVKRIVTRYHGAVDVACRHPRGTIFRFTWPREIRLDEDPLQMPPPQESCLPLHVAPGDTPR